MCGYQPDAGRLHYYYSISTLIDMIQHTYHSKSKPREQSITENVDERHVAIVLYFCTLREALLNNFLLSMMHAYDLPQKIIERLWDDNKLYSQKQNKLFPSLTKEKWNSAIQKISDKQHDYIALDAFIKNISRMRNSFLHEGNKWSIEELAARECFEHVPLLMHMHA